MAEEKKEPAPWATQKADDLISEFVDQDQRIPGLELFRRALAMARDDAYRDGLAGGISVGA
jgi:hypothetical protein